MRNPTLSKSSRPRRAVILIPFAFACFVLAFIARFSEVNVLLHNNNSLNLKYFTDGGLEKRILAYYFPQFHEFEENNRFWGKGFTDFTNVAKVTHDPLGFPVARPAERFGFYDLSLKSQRQYQASLAKAYGISGFIIMHFWFNAKPVMDKPLELLLEDGEPDIDFCLMWANEPWTARWDGRNGSDILLAQTYEETDWRPHFEWMLRFFTHENYILVDNKPMLVIYRITEIPLLHEMIDQWHAWAQEAGFAGLHIVQNNGGKWTPNAHLPQPGVDAVAEYYPIIYNGPLAPLNQVNCSFF